MSYNCQFCDFEMALELSVVYQNEYITCGSEECTDKAFANAQFHYDDARHEEMDIMVFSSLTPEDDNSWRVVAEKDYPPEISDYDIMSKMLEGCSIEIEETKTHYIALKTKEYRKLVAQEIKAETKEGVKK